MNSEPIKPFIGLQTAAWGIAVVSDDEAIQKLEQMRAGAEQAAREHRRGANIMAIRGPNAAKEVRQQREMVLYAEFHEALFRKAIGAIAALKEFKFLDENGKAALDFICEAKKLTPRAALNHAVTYTADHEKHLETIL